MDGSKALMITGAGIMFLGLYAHATPTIILGAVLIIIAKLSSRIKL